MGERWYEVVAAVKVKAADQDEALTRVSDAISTEVVRGRFPVGTFSAHECEDPIESMRRNLPPEDGSE